jgi:hypothetical protein
VTLNLKVNQKPSFRAVIEVDFDQLVAVPLAGFASFDYFLQFLLEEFIAFGKINVFMDVWKKEE